MSVNEIYTSIPLGSGSTHAHTSTWVASTLRQEIAQGRLLPGSKLSEQALADALGVSRNTLREGFTLLDSELIITRIPNRGVFVSSPGAADIREIYAVRRTIEPAALAWGPALDVPALAQAIVEARAAAKAHDVPGMADANQRFHESVVRATGSVHLLELMGRILAKMRLVFHSMSDAPDFHSHYVERNAALVELLASGQRNEAAQTLLGYLDTAEAELLDHYESSQKI
ncbi:GntR family transcriptional regulator [Arthrobacter sp. MYb211]|uniref:GntR family transcriptional regulator n=1 Tax=Micrococcaceae TaxID=1268 RepID=UPI000BB806FA|nr:MULTISPECIES: GntR family transcriptional regulator [Micrococcaceae]PCC27147.1 GntR family transcriptional regulator [Glutamicibacter sp. BW80]PQZ97317.1 GntR family transcriptional regulator [Arthrobacter sp. MYb224]PRA10839.1 GntR family transcriptional regulator [Arthrobacter sp. MYb221]PRC06900.1 GntR family transcriptional regulator [Arthrobacter sp. MYb211]